MTIEEFEQIGERLKKGKEKILAGPGGWCGREKPPCFSPSRELPKTIQERRIVLWRKLSEAHYQAGWDLGIYKAPQHEKPSKAWNDMKFREALEKWKHTLKAKRGPDPRTLPRDSFT